MYTGKKLTNTQWVSGTYNQIRNDMGSVGTSTFMTMTESSAGADNKNSLGDGVLL